MNKKYSLTVLFLVLSGICLAAYGVFLPLQPQSLTVTETRSIISEGITTTGTIVSTKKTMQKSPGSENSEAEPTLHEIAKIEYSADGRIHSVTGTRAVDGQAWEKGESVKVSYRIDKPFEAVVNERGIEGVNDTPFLPFLFMIGGFLVAGLGIFVSLGRR